MGRQFILRICFFLDSVILILLLVSLSIFLPHHSIAFRTDTSFISNTFTVAEALEEIHGILSEPSFDPRKAIELAPGCVIPKDPQIENASVTDTDTGIYAAVCLEFRYTDSCPKAQKAGRLLDREDMEALCRTVDIDYDADQTDSHWIRFEGEASGDAVQHFYYKDLLERQLPNRGQSTLPVMSRIKVNPGKKNSDLLRLQELGGFTIKVYGCVVPHAMEESSDHAVSAMDAYERDMFSFQGSTS